MTEPYDDREQPRYPLYAAPERPDCPYCKPAVKGGAPWTTRHTGPANGLTGDVVRHWVSVTDSRTSTWLLAAACGAAFAVFVDSGD